MNFLIYTLLASSLVFSEVSARIIHAPDLEVIKQEINLLDENALVVFDVDLTLIAPTDAVLKPCGDFFLHNFINATNIPIEQLQILISKISLQSKVTLLDEKILTILNKLKQNKIKTIALTAIRTGPFGAIACVEKWRFEQLKDLGINFSWSFPEIDFLKLPGFDEEITFPVFKKGIIGTAGHPKGEVLMAFLNDRNWKPSQVIFVDDRLNYIYSVERAMEVANIPVVSFYYTPAFDLPCDLDEKVASYQLEYLFKNGEWLSDAEVCRIQNQNSPSITMNLCYTSLSHCPHQAGDAWLPSLNSTLIFNCTQL